MALNRYMHPNNPYKNNRPDFKKLAVQYDYFRKVAKQSLDGKVTIDFKNPECLRALSKALLQSDYNLEVNLPANRLVPAIPQRVNYILWLDDILTMNNLSGADSTIRGLDVGCGACCIYPLLGCKIKNWIFVATEMDEVNLRYAEDNVAGNKLSDSIRVVKSNDSSLLKSAVLESLFEAASDPVFHFCMCNPPFFDSSTRSSDLNHPSRGSSRAEPDHVSTASEVERSYEGGEVEFVKKMIDESVELRDKFSFYTSLLGLKSSVSKLKSYLRQQSIKNISTTEMCQGRTMRWAIAWSFRDDITFPKSLFQQERSKEKAGFTHIIPSDITCCLYDIVSITQLVRSLLQEQLKMSLVTLNQDAAEYVGMVTAKSNTWSHSRRRRRQEQRFKRKQEVILSEEVGTDGEVCSPVKRIRLDDFATTQSAINTTLCNSTTTATSDLSCVSHMFSRDDVATGRSADHTTNLVLAGASSDDDEVEPLITFSLEIKLHGGQIKLHVKLIDRDGEKKDMLHQILQYVKNRIK